ncbi:MAG: iron ABC transporter permease, partial [Desulfobacteraceae bacterium]
MNLASPNIAKRLAAASLLLMVLLVAALFFGLAAGSSGFGISALFKSLTGAGGTELMSDIIWRLRLPRVLLA